MVKFSIFSLGGVLSGGIMIMMMQGLHNNISYNAKTLSDKVYLTKDGMHIKLTTMSSNKSRKIAISSIKHMTKE